jgi:hypothetical protein
MKTEFIPYEQALALKELGLNEPCLGWWSTTTPNIELMIEDVFPGEFKISVLFAPLYQQAFRWFREKYVLDSIIQPTYSTKYQYRIFNVENKSKVQVYGDYMGKEFNTYEEAELACLKKLIEIVKEKKD